MLRSSGYDAGVDPEAPDGGRYRKVEFEAAKLAPDVDAVVASTSLHHVTDPAEVLDRSRPPCGRGSAGRHRVGVGGLRPGDGGVVL